MGKIRLTDRLMEIDFERLKNWLAHFKLPLLQSHASGHCSREELKEAIERIKPKAVYPVHTENPLVFKEIAKGVEIIKFEELEF